MIRCPTMVKADILQDTAVSPTASGNLKMKTILKWFIPFFVLAGSSCSQRIPDWMNNHYHVTSPDGTAIVYMASYPTDSGTQTSVATWVQSNGATGGAGVFDVQSKRPVKMTMNWSNDSTVVINYDSHVRVLRQETYSYFKGHKTYFVYHPTHE